MRKRILVVINTLSRAGAETALMELLRRLDPKEYEVSLFVLTGQGEMAREVPEHVKLLNRRVWECSVLSGKGRRRLLLQTLRCMLARGTLLRLLPYLARNARDMLRKGGLLPDKLLWRVLSDGAPRLREEYDLAVAFLEGGSTYYVADHVNAKRKAAFLHVDYRRAGYTRALDRECYLGLDRVFPVSGEVMDSFLDVYPECRGKTMVFPNMLNRERIRSRSLLPGGFGDGFTGLRVLTIGRLMKQKALEVSIEAMKLLKDAGAPVRWYVLGEGDQRPFLEERIRLLRLEEDFLLPGAVENPYPYLRQADCYVHASRFEGKSIAVREAQVLGKAILVSDCNGNREQVEEGVDGLMCRLEPEDICAKLRVLLEDPALRARLGKAAAQKQEAEEAGEGKELEKLLALL